MIITCVKPTLPSSYMLGNMNGSGIHPLFSTNYYRRMNLGETKGFMEQSHLDLPDNLTIEEAQQAINVASAAKSGVQKVSDGASSVANGISGIFHGGVKIVSAIVGKTE